MRAAASELVDDLKPCSPTSAPRCAIGPSFRRRCARMPRRSRIPKARALLEWFADGAMTLLGYEVERADGPADRCARHLQHPGRSDRRGRCARRDALFRGRRRHSADGQGRAQVDASTAAFRSTWSSSRSARRGRSPASAFTPGLWTSQALSWPAEEVPRAAPPAGAARQGFRLRSQGP